MKRVIYLLKSDKLKKEQAIQLMKTVASFREAWQNHNSKDFGEEGQQTAIFMGITAGAVPLNDIEKVVTNLVQDIVKNNNTHLTTGMLGDHCHMMY